MRIINEDAKQAIREERRCAQCGRIGRVDAAHVFACGKGNAFRMDIALNLLPLCNWPEGMCHRLDHHGKITLHDKVALVAARHQMLQPAVFTVLYLLRRLPFRHEELAWMSEERLRYWNLLDGRGVPTLAGRCCGLEGVTT